MSVCKTVPRLKRELLTSPLYTTFFSKISAALHIPVQLSVSLKMSPTRSRHSGITCNLDQKLNRYLPGTENPPHPLYRRIYFCLYRGYRKTFNWRSLIIAIYATGKDLKVFFTHANIKSWSISRASESQVDETRYLTCCIPYFRTIRID